MELKQVIRNNCSVVLKVKFWLFKIAVLILLMVSLVWFFLEPFGESPATPRKEGEETDVFCADKYGYAITRRDVQLGKLREEKKNYFMTIGISTIERIQNGKRFTYLIQTLRELIKKIPERARDKVLIIIFCADEDAESRKRISDSVIKNFSEFIDSGLIQIIRAPKTFYHDLNHLPRTLNDSAVRMKWRGKQSLDYSFLFYYAVGLGKYHLQLEDDIGCDNDFFDKIEDDISKYKNSEWIILRYYRMGFIGILIKSEFLQIFADIFRMYYFEMPLDWLYIRPLHFSGLRDWEKLGSRLVFHHKGEFSSSKNFEP